MRKISKSKFAIVVTFLLALACLAGVIGLAVKLDRQTTTTTLGGEAYSIGMIDETGAYKESTASIYTRKGISVEGLKCELQDEAKIKYQLFYYDKDGKFVSASSVFESDFDGSSVPEKAELVKIVITPTADEDSKVSFTEIYGYAGQLTVTYNR